MLFCFGSDLKTSLVGPVSPGFSSQVTGDFGKPEAEGEPYLSSLSSRFGDLTW